MEATAKVGILAGTGKVGRGLALRLCAAGYAVQIGSRDQKRAAEAAEWVRERLTSIGRPAMIAGVLNAASISDTVMVFLACPFSGLRSLLPDLAPRLAGRTLVEMVNPIERRDGVWIATNVAEGSAAELIQRLLPSCRVVSAFKTTSAVSLARIDRPVQGDVLICGQDAEARAQVAGLVRAIPDLRPLDAGPLAVSAGVESSTALLLNLNRRHHATTSIRIIGLEDDANAPRDRGPSAATAAPRETR